MFTVIWRDTALDALADAYTSRDLAGQDALARIVQDLNARLAADPNAEGESRPAGYRIALVPPIGILFKVDAAASVVRVTHFWTY